MVRHNDLQKLFERMMANNESDEDSGAATSTRPLDVQARVLLDMLPTLKRPNPFKVGDLVVQRKGCAIYKWPQPGCLGIVTEAMTPDATSKIVQQGRDGGIMERVDMVVMCVAQGDGVEAWLEFAVDSWRFDMWEGDPA